MQVNVLMTTDLSRFKYLDDNRSISIAHVQRIAKSLQRNNLMSDLPIIIDKDFFVLDGQHRLEACRLLKAPVWYKFANKMDKQDITLVNSVALHWTKRQFLEMFIAQGKTEYSKFKQFMDLSGVDKVSSCIGILKIAGVGGTDTYAFRNGEFVYPVDDSKPMEIVKTLRQFEKLGYEFWNSVRFVCGIVKCFRHPEFDPERLFHKLEQQPGTLRKCSDHEQYLEVLQDIYNFKSAKQNRLYLK